MVAPILRAIPSGPTVLPILIIGLVMPSGGCIALLYGFFFSVLCNFCLAARLGTLAAIWPTAGEQYRFIFLLSAERWRKI
ncbi:uncharacterized protein FRV6_16607 [Fusarium oxysporum]|uniref:Amino acid permease/ SLC12A domain-containing protein n=1 Tax=Fusarium oxysporum TaxID=5507 RepID=A0A2H3UF84_FUSOX|nr:uncharacterized protein FRV6_16607 [Fusarium oxysporum]